MSGRRLSFSGNAQPTSLSAPILNTDMSFGVGALVGYPDTTVGPFVGTLDSGEGTLEEKVLVESYSGTVLMILERGYDGTTAQDHGLGASFVHTLDATTIDQANAFVNGVGTVEPTTSAVGDSPAEGNSPLPAAANHVHGREEFATGETSTSAPGDSAHDGVLDNPARVDHVHAREAAPEVQIPIGAAVLWPTDSPPANYVLMNQTIVGGVATWPLLAAAVPSWVSGSNLAIPIAATPTGGFPTYIIRAA